MLFKDKVAIVSGASAEAGSGWAIAEALAAEGAKVVVSARRLEPLQKLAAKIGGKAIKCDLANADEVAALARFTADTYGPIDIAVNSAGLPVTGMITDAVPENLQLALDVNYLGCVHFIKNTAALMRDGGSIIMITSYSAVQPMQPHFAYACAKAATDCLVKYAAVEYGSRGIRVNSIQPGPIKSEMGAHFFSIPGIEEAFAKEIPVGRIGVPKDYANAVLWLAGPCFVSGLNIPVNGGNQLTRIPRPDELPGGAESYDKH